jgi:hypothetical protein
MTKKAYDVSDVDVIIEGKGYTDPEVRKLWVKNQLLFDKLCAQNAPLVDVGRQCLNYALGDIFDSATRAQYEMVQEKICIEPKILKQRITSAVGQIKQAVRKGKIVSEGKGGADEIYSANALLKFIEKEAGEAQLVDRMLFMGCLTGYPQVIVISQAETGYGDPLGGMYLDLLPWDSVVMNKIDKPDGSDITDLAWITRKTQQELIDENEDRESQIAEHFANVGSKEYGMSGALDGMNLDVNDLRMLNADVLSGARGIGADGRIVAIERLSVQKVKTDIAVRLDFRGESTVDFQILPREWTKNRKSRWLTANPEYQIKTREVKMLWLSRFTTDGLMLRNEPHFFQEHDGRGNPVFNAVAFVPQIIDGIPTGPGPDDRLLVLMKAIAETEFLHDIRCGSGDLFAYKSGAVVNSDDLATELSIGNGMVAVDGELPGPISEYVSVLKRTPNTAYGEYSQRIDGMLDASDMMTPSARGATVSDRVSAKSRQMDVAMTMVGYSIVAANMNAALERLKNIECMLVPYCFTEEQEIQVYDDTRGLELKAKFNQMVYDENGESKVVSNDLTSVKWRYRLVEGDDSSTAKQAELNEMLIFWNTAAPTLINADESLMTLASVLMSMNNRTATEIGRVIAEKAQVNAQSMSQQKLMETMADAQEKNAKSQAALTKAKRAGFSFSITPDDLANIPGLYKILVGSNYINPDGNTFQNPGGMNEQPQTQQ